MSSQSGALRMVALTGFFTLFGTVAHENPWEFMHKARFGQPGIPMISLITLPDSTIADLLAYGQTLPEK